MDHRHWVGSAEVMVDILLAAILLTGPAQFARR